MMIYSFISSYDDIQLYIQITSMSTYSAFLDFPSLILVCFKNAPASTAFVSTAIDWFQDNNTFSALMMNIYVFWRKGYSGTLKLKCYH